MAGTLAAYADMVLMARVTGLAGVRVHPLVAATELVILNETLGVPAGGEEPHAHPVDMHPVSAVEGMMLAVGHDLVADPEAVVGENTEKELAGSMPEMGVVAAAVKIAPRLAVVAAELLGEVDKEAPT